MTEFATRTEMSAGSFWLKQLPAMDNFLTDNDDPADRSPNWIEDMNFTSFDANEEADDDSDDLDKNEVTGNWKAPLQSINGNGERVFQNRSVSWSKPTRGKTATRVRRAFDILRCVRGERTVTSRGVPVVTVERQFKSLRFNGRASNTTIRRYLLRKRRKIVQPALKAAA